MNLLSSPKPQRVLVEREDGTVPKLLFDLLCVASQHGFEDYIVDLLPFKKEGCLDKKGNFILKIGDKPTSMFSCHMDTVHTVSKECELKHLKPWIELSTVHPEAPAAEQGFIYGANITKTGFTNQILGADDKAGIYVISKMIEAKIPGLYVFHVGEECGGKGSKFIVETTPELVNGIQRCIAFDRKGYTDVIETQFRGRCASRKFGDAVAEALNKNMNLLPTTSEDYKFKGDQHGTFTDSANYRELIPECINLSVGYFDQHTANEKLDVEWLTTYFIPAVLKTKWDDLPTERDPKEKHVVYSSNYTYSKRNVYNGQFNSPFKQDARWVSSHTVDSYVPNWEPEEGLLLDAAPEGMKKIIEVYLNKQKRPIETAANLLFSYMLDNELMIAKYFSNDADTPDPKEDTVVDITPPKEKPPIKDVATWIKTKTIETMLDNINVPKNNAKARDKYTHIANKFGKIVLNIKANKGVASKKLLSVLNDMICKLYTLSTDLETNQNNEYKIVMANTKKYLLSIQSEKGIFFSFKMTQDLAK